MAVTMTDVAVEHISRLLRKRQTPDVYLKISLRGGGCSGFMFDYSFITDPAEKDRVFTFDDVKICIDLKSYIYLNGMEIDYKEDLLKSGLEFNIPSAKRSCGCGESFSF